MVNLAGVTAKTFPESSIIFAFDGLVEIVISLYRPVIMVPHPMMFPVKKRQVKNNHAILITYLIFFKFINTAILS